MNSKILIAISSLLILASCDVVNEAVSIVNNNTNSQNNSSNTPSLTNDEVISGLKEALSVGIKNSVKLTSVTDGFLKNNEIRLPFPPDAIKVKEKAIDLGFSNKVNEFEETLNRAAESAAKEALPILLMQ